MSDSEYSASAKDIADLLHNLEDQKKIKNMKITELKLNLKMKELTDQIKDAKLSLYQAMYDEQIEEVGGYKREKLIPAEEKKAIREEKKREAFQNALAPEIRNPQKLSNVVESLSKIKI